MALAVLNVMVMEHDLVPSLAFMCILPPPAPSFPCRLWQAMWFILRQVHQVGIAGGLSGCSRSIHSVLLMQNLFQLIGICYSQ